MHEQDSWVLVASKVPNINTTSATREPANDEWKASRGRSRFTNTVFIRKTTDVIAYRRKFLEAQWRTPHTVPVAKQSMQQSVLKSSPILHLAPW
jgi:hypothetical protein